MSKLSSPITNSAAVSRPILSSCHQDKYRYDGKPGSPRPGHTQTELSGCQVGDLTSIQFVTPGVEFAKTRTGKEFACDRTFQ